KFFVYSVSLAETETEAKKIATYNEENANHTYQPPSQTAVFTNEAALEYTSAPSVTKLAGDADRNNKINAKDSRYLRAYLSETLGDADVDIDALDINRDEDITAVDAILCKKMIAGAKAYQTFEAPGTLTDVTFDTESYALHVSDTAGKYLYLNMEHELEKPAYAVVVYKAYAGDQLMNVYAGDKIVSENKKTAPITADGKYNYFMIALPEGMGEKGISLDVTGFDLYIDSFGIFEESSNISSFFNGRVAERHLMESENIEITFTDDVMAKLDYSNHTAYSNTNPANVLKLTVSENRIDPYVYLNVSEMGISADEYKYIVYSYRLPTSTSNYIEKAQLFFCSSGAEFPAETSSVKFDLTKSGQYINEIVDLTDAVKAAETVTRMELGSNAIEYFAEDGHVDCIYGDDLSRIISMQLLKDVDITVPPVDGDVYIYDGSTNKFKTFNLTSALDVIGGNITNILGDINNLKSRVTTIEQTLTKPDNVPADVKVAWGNINDYADYTGANLKTSGIYTH
ncbi:MAG: hypothetical protein IKU19_08370, partial [Clostridia bacterium]|nr:hypothetical protein [Clostridia bacterium]